MSLARQLLSMITGLSSASFFLMALFLGIKMYLVTPSVTAHEYYQSTQVETGENLELPTQIQLADQLTVPLVPGFITNSEWEVSSFAASILVPPLLKTSDRAYIVYGHNWPTLFGELQKTTLGDQITLQTNQSELTYQVVLKTQVPADNIGILDLAKPDSLILYTCSGWLDTQRLVVFAELVTTETAL